MKETTLDYYKLGEAIMLIAGIGYLTVLNNIPMATIAFILALYARNISNEPKVKKK